MRCLLGIHKYQENWVFIEKINIYEDKLAKLCKRCGKTKVYVGMTETDIITGEKSPYVFKN